MRVCVEFFGTFRLLLPHLTFLPRFSSYRFVGSFKTTLIHFKQPFQRSRTTKILSRTAERLKQMLTHNLCIIPI